MVETIQTLGREGADIVINNVAHELLWKNHRYNLVPRHPENKSNYQGVIEIRNNAVDTMGIRKAPPIGLGLQIAYKSKISGEIMYAWLMNLFSRIFGKTAKMNMEKDEDENYSSVIQSDLD